MRTLNDFSIGLTGILSGIPVLLLNNKYLKQASFFNQISLLLAMINMILVLVGIISRNFRNLRLGFIWALYGAGNVLIGIRIFNLNLITVQNDAWKPNLAILGLISGGLSLLGHVAILGINRSIDIKLMMLMK